MLILFFILNSQTNKCEERILNMLKKNNNKHFKI